MLNKWKEKQADLYIQKEKKSLTAIAQEYYKLYWTNPGSNIPQNSIYTVTYLPSQKPSKLDEQNIWDTSGEKRINS